MMLLLLVAIKCGGPNIQTNLPMCVFCLLASVKTKKIAYAASFGLDYWEEPKTDLKEKIQSSIKMFKAISVREDSGVNICKDIFDVDAVSVLDPTLLVQHKFYENITSKFKGQISQNIVYYKLDPDRSFNKNIGTISEMLNTDSENIYYKNEFGKRYFSNVYEWLAKIAGTKLVVTDSFHCTCFAIVFRKNFICVANEVRGLGRFRSLLSKFALENRLISELSLANYEKLIECTIDYSNIEKKMNGLRQNSINFLKNALTDL